jgi:hypothetical protein
MSNNKPLRLNTQHDCTNEPHQAPPSLPHLNSCALGSTRRLQLLEE